MASSSRAEIQPKIIPNFREILNQISPLQIASQSDIIYAINRANNPSNLDEIINLLLDASNQHEATDNKMDESWMQIDVDDNEEEPPQNNLPMVKESQQQFAWKCHRCDTWYMPGESDFCLDCVSFRQQDATVVNPGPFTYRPAYLRENVVRGYLLRLKRESSQRNKMHIGVDFARLLVLRYLCLPMYDRWQYPLTRARRFGKDLCINQWNQRAQFRADHREWRSVFGSQTVSLAMCVRYTLVAVTPIKSLFIGLIPSQQITDENCAQCVSDLCVREDMVQQLTVGQNDVIDIKVDLKATAMTITFSQQKYEVKSIKINEDELDGNLPLILGASFQEKYAALEMAEFEAF